MATLLPIVLPALPAAPLGTVVTSIDASVVLLPLTFVVAIVFGLVVERAQFAWRGRRSRRATRVPRAVPIRTAA